MTFLAEMDFNLSTIFESDIRISLEGQWADLTWHDTVPELERDYDTSVQFSSCQFREQESESQVRHSYGDHDMKGKAELK